RRAAAIDRTAQEVRFNDGSAIPYDLLALTTGATPRRLPAELGGDLPGVLTMRSLADADALGAALPGASRALIVGGGYIGLEAAAALRGKGLEVTVLEAAPRILARVAAPVTADYFRELHNAHGVDIREGAALTRLTGAAGRVAGGELADGTHMPADIVLIGIGVAPDDALAAAAGLATGDGIIVDASCRTSDPRIFAAGDCTRFLNRGEMIRLESVPHAIDQGEAAAAAMLGEGAPYVARPWFWSDQYDVKLQIAGLNTGWDRTLIRPGARPGSQSVWYLAGNELL